MSWPWLIFWAIIVPTFTAWSLTKKGDGRMTWLLLPVGLAGFVLLLSAAAYVLTLFLK